VELVELRVSARVVNKCRELRVTMVEVRVSGRVEGNCSRVYVE
jgi:hypothetical protein